MEKKYTEYRAEDVLREIESQRGLTEKHFQLTDGSVIGVAYPYPVHVKTDEGYKDIDNTLIKTEDGRFYRPAAGFAEIALAAESGAEELAKLSCGEYSVSITPVTETRSAARVSVNDDKPEEGSLESVIVPQTHNSRALYEGVFENADLEYAVEETELKGNVVVKARGGKYEYRFILDTYGLEAVKEEDGRITLRSTDGEERFVISPPLMRDADGAESREAKYALEKLDDGRYSLRVGAGGWIESEERVFPVTIDPPISLTSYNNVETGTIYQYDPDACSGEGEISYIGYHSAHTSAPRMRTLVRVNTLPTLPSNSRIVYASVGLYEQGFSHSGSTTSFHIQTKPLTSNTPTSGYWCLYHTWNDCPSLATNATDYITADSQTGYRSVEITHDAIGWYADPSSNYGMCFLAYEEGSMTATNNAYAAFSSSKASNSTVRPYFLVNYRNNVGLESYYSYRIHSIDRAGTGYIGDSSGQLTIVKTDLAAASTVLPVTIEHIYNSAYGGGQLWTQEAGNGYTSMIAGRGWKLNIQQQISFYGSEDSLQYMDADGTVHYFDRDAATGVYHDEDGLGLSVTYSGGNYTMTDRKGGKMYFAGGLLSYMQDANGNRVTYGYTGGRITTVTRKNSGGTAETIATLSYDGDYISTITDLASRVTSFEYSGGKLIKVTHPDGTTVSYTYTSNKLTKAKDNESGYSVTYAYDDNGMVTQYTEYGGSTAGSTVAVSGTVGSRKYRSSGLNRTLGDSDDIITSCVFDDFGRTVTEYTTNYNKRIIYGATSSRYGTNDGTSGKNNRLSIASALGMRPVGSTSPYECEYENLLTNGEMVEASGGWSGGGSYINDSTFPHALRVEGGIGTDIYLSQTVTVNKSGKQTYIFSGWAKAHSVPLSEDNRKFELHAKLTYTDNTVEEQAVSFCADTSEWQYNVLPIVPKSPNKTVHTIKVSLHFADNLNAV